MGECMFGWFKKKKQVIKRFTAPEIIRMKDDGLPVWGIHIFNEDGSIKSTEEFSTREKALERAQHLTKPSSW